MIRIRRPARIVLAAALVFALVAGVAPIQPTEAVAAGPEQLLNLPMRKVRILTGLVGLFGAFNARNRVYRDARIVQGERNAYYDGLRDMARDQLHSDNGIKTYDALDQTKANTYLRLVQNIENRRAFATELIEDEKRGARGVFHRTVRDTLVTALVQSKGGQELLGRIQGSLNDFAERIGEVRAALEKGSPDLALDRLASKVTDIPQLREQLKILGGEAASALDRQLNGLLTKANTIREGGVGAADEALATVNAMSAELQVQVNADRRSRSSAEEASNPVEISVPAGGGNEASADAIAAAITTLVLEQNPVLDPARRPQMRQRVADLIQKDTLDHSREIRTALGQKIVTCKAESVEAYLRAASTLGSDTNIPDGEVQFFVCYLKPQDNPIYTFIVEAEEEETEEEGAPWDESSSTSTAPTLEAGLAIPPGTYKGTFDEDVAIPLTYADYRSARVNEASITIDEFGTITGSARLHFDDIEAFFGCPAYDRWTITITKGQQIGPRLPAVIDITVHGEDMRTTPCHGCGCYDEQNAYEFTEPWTLELTAYEDEWIAGVYEDFPFALHVIED
ncbi:MAG: hypothetical protein U9N79_10240 [Actinomycetota bacterium]|nr:hypothetical protein [Actinomycetota bacterium]